MNIKTYRKENGDLNLDIESVVERYPEIAGSKWNRPGRRDVCGWGIQMKKSVFVSVFVTCLLSAAATGSPGAARGVMVKAVSDGGAPKEIRLYSGYHAQYGGKYQRGTHQ